MPADRERGEAMTRLVDQVRLAFDLASLRLEAGRNLSGNDWREYRRIQETHDQRRGLVERDFALTYGARVADARRRLIDEAGGKALDLTPRLFGRDRFDHGAIDRQAHKEVHLAHRSALGRIDREEARAIEGLLERTETGSEGGERTRRDFANAADRRGAPDRRRRHD